MQRSEKVSLDFCCAADFVHFLFVEPLFKETFSLNRFCFVQRTNERRLSANTRDVPQTKNKNGQTQKNKNNNKTQKTQKKQQNKTQKTKK